MLKRSQVMSAVGMLVLLVGFSNQYLTASGSSGHWGYVISVQKDRDEVPVLAAGGIKLTLQQFIDKVSPPPADQSDAINIPSVPGGSSNAAPAISTRAAGGPPPGSLSGYYPPERLRIPSIRLDAPVVDVQMQEVSLDGQTAMQWLPPDEFAAGWQQGSASLGRVGNTVLNGHNNIFGSVFAVLYTVSVGDQILLDSGGITFVYQITNIMKLKEKYEPLSTRLENAQWLQPSTDERVTLVTCWPPRTNLYRLIVVASPVSHFQTNAAENHGVTSGAAH